MAAHLDVRTADVALDFAVFQFDGEGVVYVIIEMVSVRGQSFSTIGRFYWDIRRSYSHFHILDESFMSFYVFPFNRCMALIGILITLGLGIPSAI